MQTEAIERCTADAIGIAITAKSPEDEQLSSDLIAAIDDYLSVFARPIVADRGGSISGSLECLKCGSRLNGLLGTFRWGLVHGEGRCSQCGWPARAYHRIKDDEGEIFDSPLQFILQYHPDHVEKKES